MTISRTLSAVALAVTAGLLIGALATPRQAVAKPACPNRACATRTGQCFDSDVPYDCTHVGGGAGTDPEFCYSTKC